MGDNKRDRSRSPRSRGSRERGGREQRSGYSDRLVYISNIPYTLRWMELKDMVREKAGDVSFVEMLETSDGKSKGCAVVEFKDKEGAQKCVDVMNRMPIGDRNLVVKEIRDPERFFRKVKEDTGIDFLGKGGSIIAGGGSRQRGGMSVAASSFSHVNYETYGLSPAFLNQLNIDCPLCNRVFIANLDFKVGSLKLHEVFSLAGHVVSVDLQMDKEGKSKGLAVVEFAHPIEAVQAISMFHNQYLYDRKLTVKMDRFDKALDDRRPGELPSGLKNVGPGLGEGGAPLTNIAQAVSNYPSVPQAVSGSAGLVGNGIASLMSTNTGLGGVGGSMGLSSGPQSLGGLGLGSVSNPGQGLLGSASGNLSSLGRAPSPRDFSVSVSRNDESGRFGATDGILSATGQYRSLAGLGSASNVDLLSERLLTEQQRSLMGGGSYERLGGSANSALAAARSIPLGQSVASRDSYLARSGSPFEFKDFKPQMAQSPSVVVRNLPRDYTWQLLKDRMRNFAVEHVDMIQPGIGKVRFGTVRDAEQAIRTLNGLGVEGRTIQVEFA